MKKYCFGIDVGGTTVKCGLFQVDGVLMDKWEIPTRTENQGEEILPDIAKAILEKLQEKGIQKEEVAGIGVGVPGPVNSEGDVLCAVNLFWGYKKVSKELGEMTGIPVKAENDANVAALGEAWRGAAAGAQNVVMVTLGTGVGGGIIVNEQILSGAHGASGEIGHINVDHEETESCNCGNQGCLEQMASATGVVRLAKKALDCSDAPSVLREGELTAKAVFDAYKAGDKLAEEVVEKFGDYLGGALASVTCVIDPSVIVVGGGVSKAGQPLIDCVTKYYKKYAFSACKATPIILAALGNDAGIYGAAKMVI
ncbi:MAG TPA: ROK family glucokinase [Candidatus Blautia intestinigallinarum]|nr:ROK family glucokinase [Candidatus Blautia intestinigallinarum]